MEYKALPENITSDSKTSSIMEPFDTIDVEKNMPTNAGYGTIPSHASKEGWKESSAQTGKSIWLSLVQSIVAVGMFTAMAVTLVLIVLA